MTASDVFGPPTTSTRGTMWGGLKGCPITQRSGRLAPTWITSMGMPDELDARIAPGGAASSMSANSLTLNSGRSGAFSWTKSASASARPILGVNVSRSREAPAVTRPAVASAGQASSTYLGGSTPRWAPDRWRRRRIHVKGSTRPSLHRSLQCLRSRSVARVLEALTSSKACPLLGASLRPDVLHQPCQCTTPRKHARTRALFEYPLPCRDRDPPPADRALTHLGDDNCA